MTKISGSESGSISQRYGSADPDPHQNVMGAEHWPELFGLLESGSVVNLSNFRLKSGQICRSIETFFRRKASKSWRIVFVYTRSGVRV